MIYVASPYSNPDKDIVQENYENVTKYVAELTSQGKIVFSPIVYGHTLLQFKEMPTDWEFWNHFCISFLDKCEEVHVLKLHGWYESTGVQAEIFHAENNQVPIKYIHRNVIDGTS